MTDQELTLAEISELTDEARRRAELLTWAEDRERAAVRADEAAEDGDRVANDPERSELVREQARACARLAREHAAEYRHEAAIFRAGEIPECYWPGLV